MIHQRFGPIWGSIITHRLGADLYFLIFGIFGIFFIPAFFYFKMRSNWKKRKAIDQKYGINEEMDLDERSLQFIPYDRDALRKELLAKHKNEQQIKKLEKEIYGY